MKFTWEMNQTMKFLLIIQTKKKVDYHLLNKI